MATISGMFGSTIRDRRRQLHLTQEELSHLINTSVSYISNLEGGRRRASEKVVMKLAEVLGLDAHELLLFAIPKIGSFLSELKSSEDISAWKTLLKNEALRETYNITDRELEMMSKVAMMGEVRSSQDFIFILKSIRQALRKMDRLG
jgi:transcriptional regulator with XRE-family HTH domain